LLVFIFKNIHFGFVVPTYYFVAQVFI
jgi:hypothetical protein